MSSSAEVAARTPERLYNATATPMKMNSSNIFLIPFQRLYKQDVKLRRESSSSPSGPGAPSSYSSSCYIIVPLLYFYLLSSKAQLAGGGALPRGAPPASAPAPLARTPNPPFVSAPGSPMAAAAPAGFWRRALQFFTGAVLFFVPFAPRARPLGLYCDQRGTQHVHDQGGVLVGVVIPAALPAPPPPPPPAALLPAPALGPRRAPAEEHCFARYLVSLKETVLTLGFLSSNIFLKKTWNQL
ncbi:hypothetical protein GB937_000794 [Aspergillus fischeri]|nr:hypothetical protein GB937_000794 [Aspergillus fischeri]